MRRSRLLAFLVALAAGAGATLSFFLDPVSGRRRRHQARDQVSARARRARHRSRRFVRHLSSDAYGAVQRALHSGARRMLELDDATLAHKVESILFRDHSVPKGRININAEGGVVYLRGQLDTPELIRAVEARARRIAGVRSVVSLLHLPDTPVAE